MRTPIIAGNWKMHGSRQSVDDLLFHLQTAAQFAPHVQLIVFPPAVFLEQTERLLAGGVMVWGGQNFYPEASGAFTGEVSASMLTDVGCRFVIVGHSERRNLFGETDEMVARKYQVAVESGLTPIVCVGESLQQREQGLTFTVLRQQLDVLFNVPGGITKLIQAVIAYEPVWAIGTGVNASPAQAQEVHATIRAWVADYDKDIAASLRIIYGGSVKRDNAAALFAMPDIDGGLVGGASLNAREFIDIAQAFPVQKVFE